ncbi:hypothetical protein ABFX02_12G086500 [Erythranthe guttata]
MEDGNMIAADCIVICCCCQCMILQIIIFILVKLPNKLLKKTREYAKRFRSQRRKRRRTKKIITQIEITTKKRYDEDSLSASFGNSFRVESFRFGSSCDCMHEIENVLEDFSSRGEFAFGSFWGGEASRSFRSCCLNEEVLDYDNVGFRLMELFGGANFSCHH